MGRTKEKTALCNEEIDNTINLVRQRQDKLTTTLQKQSDNEISKS